MYRCFSWYEFVISTSSIVPAIYLVVIRCITLPCYSRSTLSPIVGRLFHPTGSLLLPSAKIDVCVSTHLYKISLYQISPCTQVITLNHSSFAPTYFSSGSFIAHWPSLLPSPSSQCHSIKVVLTLLHTLILSTMLEGTKTISMVTKSSKYLISI